MSSRSRRADPPAGKWTLTLSTPKPTLVAFERPDRNNLVFLRWWNPSLGRYEKLGLGFGLRDEAGRILKEALAIAESRAHAAHIALVAGQDPRKPHGASRTGSPDRKGDGSQLTIHDGMRLMLDPESGSYAVSPDPVAKRLRKDMERAGKVIKGVFPHDLLWTDTKPISAAQRVWRAIAESHDLTGRGYRTAERTVELLMRTAEWLTEHGHLPEGTWLRHSTWRRELKKDWSKLTGVSTKPKTEHLRHTPEEAGLILRAAEDPGIDPRIRLLFRLGFGARLGQVVRCQRSDLRLEGGPLGYGDLHVEGRGNRHGVPLPLDQDLRVEFIHVLSQGYLRDLEAARQSGTLEDYPLFPSAHLRRGVVPVQPSLPPMLPSKIRKGLKQLERRAGVEHVKGRGWYGMRRLMADQMVDLNLSPRVQEQVAGWSHGSRMADRYQQRAQEKHLREAAEARGQIRENLDEAAANPRGGVGGRQPRREKVLPAAAQEAHGVRASDAAASGPAMESGPGIQAGGVCDRCGGPVPGRNDAMELLRLTPFGHGVPSTGASRHLLAVVENGRILCYGSPEQAQYLEGQPRDPGGSIYFAETQALWRDAWRRLQEAGDGDGEPAPGP